jgi:hypothetical protein
MSVQRIPSPVAVVVGRVLGAHYYSHRHLNNLFVEKGAPGDPPEGNCEDKCTNWLKRSSLDPTLDAFSILGGVLEEFMEVDRPRLGYSQASLEEWSRQTSLQTTASPCAFSYTFGAHVHNLRSRDMGC